MADEDRELWNSASADNQEAPAVVEKPEQTEPMRDERGRFTSPDNTDKKETAEEPAEKPAEQLKSEQTDPKQEEQPPVKEQGHDIPSWRLREEAEARRAAEERASKYERDLEETRRQIVALQQQNKPKVEPPASIFDDEAGFVDYRTNQAVEPVKSELSQLREFYSHRDAVREYGADKVKAAFTALDQAARSGDREAMAAVERVKQSMHPYGDIVEWHAKQTIYSTIGNDPDAYVDKRLEERLKDPAYQAKLFERLRGQAKTRPPATSLPPSLNKATASNPQDDDDEDLGEGALLKSALRR